jgi:hypothetical protein
MALLVVLEKQAWPVCTIRQWMTIVSLRRESSYEASWRWIIAQEMCKMVFISSV